MAVIQCNEIWEGRGGSDQASANRATTRVYRVITDTTTDNEFVIKASGVIPPLRSPHPDDPGQWVDNRDFRQDPQSYYVWIVTVQYAAVLGLRAGLSSSGGSGGGSPAEMSENPLLRPPSFSFSTLKYDLAIDTDSAGDYNGSGINADMINSASEPFLPPVTRPRGRLLLTYKRNRQSYNPFAFEPLLGRINGDVFANFFPEYTLLFDDHSADDKFENGIVYWETTCKFQVASNSWQTTRIKDQGFRTLDPATGKLTEITDGFGKPLTRPARLDGLGAQITDPLLASYYHTFYLYPKGDFSVIE